MVARCIIALAFAAAAALPAAARARHFSDTDLSAALWTTSGDDWLFLKDTSGSSSSDTHDLLPPPTRVAPAGSAAAAAAVAPPSPLPPGAPTATAAADDVRPWNRASAESCALYKQVAAHYDRLLDPGAHDGAPATYFAVLVDGFDAVVSLSALRGCDASPSRITKRLASKL